MGIFFGIPWLLFTFAVTKEEQLPYLWVLFVFIIPFFLLKLLKAGLFSSSEAALRLVNASATEEPSGRRDKRKGEEVEEEKHRRAQMIFREIAAGFTSQDSATNKRNPAIHYKLARAYSLFSKPREALFHLRLAVEEDCSCLAKIKKDKDFAGLRLSQEFRKFEAGIGMPEG